MQGSDGAWQRTAAGTAAARGTARRRTAAATRGGRGAHGTSVTIRRRPEHAHPRKKPMHPAALHNFPDTPAPSKSRAWTLGILIFQHVEGDGRMGGGLSLRRDSSRHRHSVLLPRAHAADPVMLSARSPVVVWVASVRTQFFRWRWQRSERPQRDCSHRQNRPTPPLRLVHL